jgi:ribose 5-phosphate isomerase B
MKISIASDHGGYALKQSLIQYLIGKGHDVTNCGTNSTDSCDYSDFVFPACQLLQEGAVERAIVICTTGIGASITANKCRGIRCALCHSVDAATLTRAHNDANCLALGAKYTDDVAAKSIVDAFIATPFEGGRHQRRVDKITEIENNQKQEK